MRNPYMKFQNPSMHGSWRMDTTRNQYAPSTSLKLGGHNNIQQMEQQMDRCTYPYEKKCICDGISVKFTFWV